MQLTADDARQSMQAHLSDKGAQIQQTYGPQIGWGALIRLLSDSRFVRYPCEIVFDASDLLEGEAAHVLAKGERPEAGFRILVHPYYATQLNRVPLLVLYQLVVVNYGEFASSDDAEVFGACALGIPREDYYRALCSLVDEITDPAPEAP